MPITWIVLFAGLKNNWLTVNEVVTLVNENSDRLNCDEETLIEINVTDDKSNLLDILRTRTEDDESKGVDVWQLAQLIAIKNSDIALHEKLKKISSLWSRFSYPESWRAFIYYMPNESTNTEVEVYQIFLNFVESEMKKLNWMTPA